MFRKPRPSAAPSSVLGLSPSQAPVSSPLSPPTPDQSVSPPSAKKQKTTHAPLSQSQPSFARPRPPQQSRLTSFLSTPSPPKPTPSPSYATRRKVSGAKRGNRSILSFFRPLQNGVRKRNSAAGNDDLFIRHGGYELDVSDPEDEDGDWYQDPNGVATQAEADAARRFESPGELELSRSMHLRDEQGDDHEPDAQAEREDTIEEERTPLTAAVAPPSPVQTPDETRKPAPAPPGFDPSAIKLDLSRSMLFAKSGSSGAPIFGLKRRRTGSGSSDSIAEEEGVRPSNGAGSAPKEPEHSDGNTGTLVNKRSVEAADEIEDSPSVAHVDTGTPDDIDSTQARPATASSADFEDMDEDFPDPEADLPWDEDGFVFDPAGRAIEDGWPGPDGDYGDLEIIMKPPDEEHDGSANDLSCPICAAKLGELSDQDRNSHVNHCLDGDPIPLPDPTPKKPARTSASLASASAGGPSAFTKLMSTNTESHAWAAAARAELESRGKRAVERTCPFYKILFNGPIVVDGFRYGSVPGCTAYFLSHFHADHYGGLTSKWNHGPIYCSPVTANFVRSKLGVDAEYVHELPWETAVEVPNTGGVRVTGIDANHCPGSMMFLFEKDLPGGRKKRILHCGDFRADRRHLEHPLLKPGKGAKENSIDQCYLDTTYLNPRYSFPSQKMVIDACAELCVEMNDGNHSVGSVKSARGVDKFVSKSSPSPATSVSSRQGNDKGNDKDKDKGKLLVVVGTYSIGKERICLGIARALKSKIYAPASKISLMHLLEDPSISSLLTTSPAEAQVHMAFLSALSPSTLRSYLDAHSRHGFTRIVGFSPSGWNYRPPRGRAAVPSVRDVLFSESWKSAYGVEQVARSEMRGSDRSVKCYTVPYSEHSSFRELTMFGCALDMARIVPTVNVGSAKSRERMKAWVEKWEAWKRREGLFVLGEGSGSAW